MLNISTISRAFSLTSKNSAECHCMTPYSQQDCQCQISKGYWSGMPPHCYVMHLHPTFRFSKIPAQMRRSQMFLTLMILFKFLAVFSLTIVVPAVTHTLEVSRLGESGWCRRSQLLKRPEGDFLLQLQQILYSLVPILTNVILCCLLPRQPMQQFCMDHKRHLSEIQCGLREVSVPSHQRKGWGCQVVWLFCLLKLQPDLWMDKQNSKLLSCFSTVCSESMVVCNVLIPYTFFKTQ